MVVEEAFRGIVQATHDDLMPRVVSTVIIRAVTDVRVEVFIVECVSPRVDGAAHRGDHYNAVMGRFTLRAAHIEQGRAVIGADWGGVRIGTGSTAQAAEVAARRYLAGRRS